MIKKGLVIADAEPIFSLALVDKLGILSFIFEEVKIPKAIWEEITYNEQVEYYYRIKGFFEDRIIQIKSVNEFDLIMDKGESEAITLYKEIGAEFLLIDDKKARKIAENLEVKCIGTLGLLSIAKDIGVIDELRPLFDKFQSNGRYYATDLLNAILEQHEENKLGNQ